MKTIPVKRELDAFANGSLQQIQATDRMHALLVTRADALMGCTEGSRQQTFVTSEHPRVSVRYLIDPRSTEEVCHARYIQGWSDRTIAVANVLRSGGRYAGGRWHRRRLGSRGCRTARGRSWWSARCRGRRPEHHFGAPSLPQMLARSQWLPSLRAALKRASRQANERAPKHTGHAQPQKRPVDSDGSDTPRASPPVSAPKITSPRVLRSKEKALSR